MKAISGNSHQNFKDLNNSNISSAHNNNLSDLNLGQFTFSVSPQSQSNSGGSFSIFRNDSPCCEKSTDQIEKVCKSELLHSFDPDSLREPIDTDQACDVFIQCGILYNEFLSKIKKPELKQYLKESNESIKKTKSEKGTGRGILSRIAKSKSRELINDQVSRSTSTLNSENISKKFQEIEVKKILPSLPTYPECLNEEEIVENVVTSTETKLINETEKSLKDTLDENKPIDQTKEIEKSEEENISIHEEMKLNEPIEIKTTNQEIVCQNNQEQNLGTHLNESFQNLSIASYTMSHDSSLSAIENMLKEQEQFREKLLRLRSNVLDNLSVKSNGSSHVSKNNVSVLPIQKNSQNQLIDMNNNQHQHQQLQQYQYQHQQFQQHHPPECWYLCTSPMCIENHSSNLRQQPTQHTFHVDQFRQNNMHQLENNHRHPICCTNYDNHSFYRPLPNNQDSYDQNKNQY